MILTIKAPKNFEEVPLAECEGLVIECEGEEIGKIVGANYNSDDELVFDIEIANVVEFEEENE